MCVAFFVGLCYNIPTKARNCYTFCSNMAKSGMNPKTLQYIMGHSDISVTLNTYTHVQFDDAKTELLRVAGR